MVIKVNAVVKMDKQGRIIIPAKIREKLGTDIFLLEMIEDTIYLKPVKTVKLIDLIDTVEIDIDDFTDTHKLRKALMAE